MQPYELYKQEKTKFLVDKPSFTSMMAAINNPDTSDVKVMVYFCAMQELLIIRTEWPEDECIQKHNILIEAVKKNHPECKFIDKE